MFPAWARAACAPARVSERRFGALQTERTNERSFATRLCGFRWVRSKALRNMGFRPRAITPPTWEVAVCSGGVSQRRILAACGFTTMQFVHSVGATRALGMYVSTLRTHRRVW